jgi:hypothetical protein
VLTEPGATYFFDNIVMRKVADRNEYVDGGLKDSN